MAAERLGRAWRRWLLLSLPRPSVLPWAQPTRRGQAASRNPQPPARPVSSTHPRALQIPSFSEHARQRDDWADLSWSLAEQTNALNNGFTSRAFVAKIWPEPQTWEWDTQLLRSLKGKGHTPVLRCSSILSLPASRTWTASLGHEGPRRRGHAHGGRAEDAWATATSTLWLGS